mmetsp:Transcript_167084/g.321046  ORF Transcript_167084/g.321046 Transcript_167084/m.321046 type:complete len:642 (-) Transcript_167084:90-2015(-)
MRKIAFALACLPVACEGHGHGAQTSMSRMQRPAARAQKPLQGSGASPSFGDMSAPRRPKNTFGKLLLKQSHGLVEPKPKETFGKLLLSLNPTTASLVAQSSDPRGRSYMRHPASSSSHSMASNRQGRAKHQSSGRSGSSMAGQRSSGADKRKRSRTPGKRPSDLPPPRADSSFFNDASSKKQGNTLFKRFNMKVLGTILTLVFGLAFWLVSARTAKEAQSKAGRIAKKQKAWNKHKTNAKGQRPVQRQAQTSAPQMTPKSSQEVEMPATSVSENVKVEETKKIVSRPPAAKKAKAAAKKKARRTEDKQNNADEQADSPKQVESMGSVDDQQTVHVKKEEIMTEEVDGLQSKEPSSSAAEDQTDIEPASMQCGRGGADDNGSSCRHDGEGVALSPDSTVASSGESASEGDSVVAGADEDSDQVRTEYIKNDESDMLEQQTTTASLVSHRDVDSQQLNAASPSSSSGHTGKCEGESVNQDEDPCESGPLEATEEASKSFSSSAWTPQPAPSEAVGAPSEAVEAAVDADAPCSNEEHDWQHPVGETSKAKEPELDSDNAILPPGVSLTSGTTFTDGRQVFTPCVSQDGQQWFTDGKQLYTAMYVPVPLDMNGAAMPSPSHASSTYQSPCWNSSWEPAWQPHSGW